VLPEQGAVRDGDADHHVLQLQLGVLQLVFDVDVAAAVAVVAGPAVDRERDVGFVGGGEAPLEDADTRVQREWFGRILQSDHTPGLE
jgi:hypothetical protein